MTIIHEIKEYLKQYYALDNERLQGLMDMITKRTCRDCGKEVMDRTGNMLISGFNTGTGFVCDDCLKTGDEVYCSECRNLCITTVTGKSDICKATKIEPDPSKKWLIRNSVKCSLVFDPENNNPAIINKNNSCKYFEKNDDRK